MRPQPHRGVRFRDRRPMLTLLSSFGADKGEVIRRMLLGWRPKSGRQCGWLGGRFPFGYGGTRFYTRWRGIDSRTSGKDICGRFQGTVSVLRQFDRRSWYPRPLTLRKGGTTQDLGSGSRTNTPNPKVAPEDKSREERADQVDRIAIEAIKLRGIRS